MYNISMDDIELDKGEGVDIVQVNDDNTRVDHRGRVKGNVENDVPIHHRPTLVNVHVPNQFC